MKQGLRMNGWKKKKMGDVGFLKCPYCEDYRESVSLDSEGYYRCVNCKKRVHKENLISVTLKKPVVECFYCGEDVSLTFSNLDFLGGYDYLCPNCNNMVAVRFNKEILKPKEVLDIGWNKALFNGSVKIEDGLFLKSCNSEKDSLIMKILQLLAKEEDTGFRYIDLEHQKAFLLFNEEKYLGFIVWTENKHATLRQIYVLSEERKKGYAEKMLKYWVENISDKINKEFVVETPNAKSQSLLIKMGYAKIEGDKVVGVKCGFRFEG